MVENFFTLFLFLVGVKDLEMGKSRLLPGALHTSPPSDLDASDPAAGPLGKLISKIGSLPVIGSSQLADF